MFHTAWHCCFLDVTTGHQGCRWVLARRCWRSHISEKGVVEAHFSIWRWSGFALLIPWASLDCEMLLLHQQRFSGIIIYPPFPPPPPKKKTPEIHIVIGSMDSPIITLHSQDFFWQIEYSMKGVIFTRDYYTVCSIFSRDHTWHFRASC